MAKKQPDPAAILTQGLIDRLEALRYNDPDGYMPSLRALIEQTGEPPEEATVKKALGRKQFKERLLLVNPKDPDSPVAFHEDAEKLADSPRLLDYLKSKATRAEGEPFLLKDLQKGIGGGKGFAPFKAAFEAAVRRKIEAGEAPDIVEKRPKAPKVNKAAELAARLVKVLESQRPLGSKAYPLSLGKLADLAEAKPDANEKLIFQAVGKPDFKKAVVIAWGGKDLAAPVAFADDVEQLARAPQVWEHALRENGKGVKGKTIAARAFPAKKLASKLDKRLQPAFLAAAENGADALPPNVGAVRVDTKGAPQFFFLLEDLLPASLASRLGAAPSAESRAPAAAPAAVAAPAAGQPPTAGFEAFARQFEETFSRLDRQHGGHNFVSLAEMRRELNTLTRAEFDAHLRRLRIENRFALSGAQSKQGLPDDVREAGITEAGHLLTYVSRRT